MHEQPDLPTASQRLGVGCELPGLMHEFGVDPLPLLAEIGVDPDQVTPGLRLPFHDLHHLLRSAAMMTGCDHLGLLCGLRFDLGHHGIIGELMKSAPTLRHALQDFVRWQPGYSSGAIVYLHRSGPEYAFGYGMLAPGTEGTEILYDAVAAVGVRLVKLLTNGKAAPVEVHLSRRPPSHANYSGLLHVPVRFGQDRTCLILDEQAMQTVLPQADPSRRAAVLEVIKQHGQFGSLSVADRVRHEIRRALLDGAPHMSGIADTLGIETRTLRRKLKDEGTTFSTVKDEVRLVVAWELLELTNLSIADVAAAQALPQPASSPRRSAE
jgi:AraC-like DNA-binding protein